LALALVLAGAATSPGAGMVFSVGLPQSNTSATAGLIGRFGR
jgi:hypothetical protein